MGIYPIVHFYLLVMGNCCEPLSRLFTKKENRTRNDSLIVHNPDDQDAADLTIPPHVGESKNKRFSFKFGSPISLNSEESKSSQKGKEQNTSGFDGDESKKLKTFRKQESEEEGYGSSFEAVPSTSKEVTSKDESENKVAFVDGVKNYEIEIETALASIKDADESKKEKRKDDDSNESPDDYYSI